MTMHEYSFAEADNVDSMQLCIMYSGYLCFMVNNKNFTKCLMDFQRLKTAGN